MLWIPCHTPIGRDIADRYVELSDNPRSLDDDVTWSKAVGQVLILPMEHLQRNHPIVKPGEFLKPIVPRFFIQRPGDQAIVPRFFSGPVEVTGLLRAVETGQYLFRTTVGGSTFNTPFDSAYFERAA
ncbi:MAG: hypothetical protein RLY57_279 [Candidatus Parcubacteria bacterium]|jgi:hypothetical protein